MYQEKFMERAIELSRQGGIIEKTGGVFGAVVVKDGVIVGEGYNQVIKTHDPTWHAEIHAIREASRTLQNPHLEGCDLYTSAECCPMCLAAAYWAHIRHIYYASKVEDALKYGNFADVDIYNEIKKEPCDRRIAASEKMRAEALVVWKEFHDMPGHVHY